METLADFGTVSYFARRGVHHRHLQGLVLDGRQRRRGAALDLPARLRRGGARARAREPRPRRVPRHRAAQGRAAAAACAARRRSPRSPPAPRRWCSASLLPGAAARRARLGRASARSARGSLALVGNSFALAGLTALVAVALATADGLRGAPHAQPAGRRRRTALAGLGYAVPGAVIAVGVLVPLGRLDNCARRLARARVRRQARAAADRHHRGAGLRLPGAAARGGAADHGRGARQDHAEHGRRRALARRHARRRRSRACTCRCSRRAWRRRRCWCSSTC